MVGCDSLLHVVVEVLDVVVVLLDVVVIVALMQEQW
jgi:hypothetical protein